ncbi:MAG: acyltransferase [Spirochaetales bacterium]|nr:acyltransferase [Spirochaetales bacterium]
MESAMKKGILFDIHYFRAFAIINVILVHILRLPEDLATTHYGLVFKSMREVLFHDSTIYFIFISGFLFKHLSSKTGTGKYYLNKFKNVVIPYTVISLLLIFFNIASGKYPDFTVPEILTVFLTGKVQIQFWYIPFIIPVFVISPFFLKIPAKYFTAIALAALCLPLLGTRTGTDITIGTYLYFLPVYTLGILCSAHYDRFIHFYRKYTWLAGVVAILSTAGLLMIHCNDFYPIYSFLNLIETLFYIQKISFLLVIMRFLQVLNENHRYLRKIADYSFAAFFLHNIVAKIIYHFAFPVIIEMQNYVAITVILFLSVFLIIVLTFLLSFGVKKISGKYSRYLIGV